MNEDLRFIHYNGETQGPYTPERLMRMRTKGELPDSTLFWSESRQLWLPIAALLNDLERGTTVEAMLELGFKKVEVLSSGTGDECPACLAIEGVHNIERAPKLPPDGCTCIPWCRCCLVVAEPT